MGLDPDVFWDMTPREYALAVRGWQERQKARHNELAWHTCHICNTSGFLKEPIRYEDMCITDTPTKGQKFNKVKAAFEEAVRNDNGG